MNVTCGEEILPMLATFVLQEYIMELNLILPQLLLKHKGENVGKIFLPTRAATKIGG